MKVLLTGAAGQLGRELQRTANSHCELAAFDHAGLDIANADLVAQTAEEVAPDVVINAAAYTAVDRAEEDEETALAVNAFGARNIARAAADQNARLIHISTDFVFSGESGRPYSPTSEPDPRSAYGASKLSGEQKVLETISDSAVILRTAWVYSQFGHNFVKTMLRLMQKESEIEVVCDQVGSPTWAHGLAQAVWTFTARPELTGIFHWTDSGVASWYDFAVAIENEARVLGILGSDCTIKPIDSSRRPTAARRPPFGVLDKTSTWEKLGLVSPHWRVQLRAMLRQSLEASDE